MAWVVLFVAGVLEIGWAVGLKHGGGAAGQHGPDRLVLEHAQRAQQREVASVARSCTYGDLCTSMSAGVSAGNPFVSIAFVPERRAPRVWALSQHRFQMISALGFALQSRSPVTVTTRPANLDDAAEAVALLRRSITELCVADHKHDEATLAAWLANKTVERFARWHSDPASRVVIAEAEGSIRGVGSIHDSGDLRLCYVLPGYQRVGVGRALLAALEAHALSWQVARIHLSASSGARPFYERFGYRPAGPPEPGFGLTVRHPYEKLFSPASR